MTHSGTKQNKDSFQVSAGNNEFPDNRCEILKIFKIFPWTPTYNKHWQAEVPTKQKCEERNLTSCKVQKNASTNHVRK